MSQPTIPPPSARDLEFKRNALDRYEIKRSLLRDDDALMILIRLLNDSEQQLSRIRDLVRERLGKVPCPRNCKEGFTGYVDFDGYSIKCTFCFGTGSVYIADTLPSVVEGVERLCKELAEHKEVAERVDAAWQKTLERADKCVVDTAKELWAAQAELAALRSQRDELLAAAEWRDIATAPQDDQDVLLWSPVSDENEECVKVGFRPKPGMNAWDNSTTGWINPKPTHWKPLGPPPGENGGTQG